MRIYNSRATGGDTLRVGDGPWLLGAVRLLSTPGVSPGVPGLPVESRGRGRMGGGVAGTIKTGGSVGYDASSTAIGSAVVRVLFPHRHKSMCWGIIAGSCSTRRP